MATTMTLTNLILQCRQRSDMVNSQFVTDSEITAYINQSYQELYDLLVQSYGDDYFVKTPAYTFTTDGTNDQFALPTDFQKLLGVDVAINGTEYVTVPKFNFAERNRYSGPGLRTYGGMTNLSYRLSGNYLWLSPLPAAGQTVRVWYIPELTALASGSDTAMNLGGWIEYVITDVCIKMLVKEESDISVFAGQKVALMQRIQSAAANRDAGSPATVSDVTGRNSWDWDSGFGWND